MPSTPRRPRASDPETYLGGIGDPANIGLQTRGRILCAHAGQDGQGVHWTLPGQACTATAERNSQKGARAEAVLPRVPIGQGNL